jgi:hypothetical protein
MSFRHRLPRGDGPVSAIVPQAQRTCPASETLAAFMEGRYPDGTKEHRAVIKHMAGCGECRTVAGDVAAGDTLPEQETKP